MTSADLVDATHAASTLYFLMLSDANWRQLPRSAPLAIIQNLRRPVIDFSFLREELDQVLRAQPEHSAHRSELVLRVGHIERALGMPHGAQTSLMLVAEAAMADRKNLAEIEAAWERA